MDLIADHEAPRCAPSHGRYTRMMDLRSFLGTDRQASFGPRCLEAILVSLYPSVRLMIPSRAKYLQSRHTCRFAADSQVFQISDVKFNAGCAGANQLARAEIRGASVPSGRVR